MVISLAQVLFIVSAVKITLAPVAQLSVAVTVAGAGTNSTHNTVVSLGTPTNAGGILSFMVICCIPVSYTHLDVYKRQELQYP